jgi:hypothetical protein
MKYVVPYVQITQILYSVKTNYLMLFNEIVATNVRIVGNKYKKWTKWWFFNVTSCGINSFQWSLNC